MKNLDPIPHDFAIEVLTLLPTKSLMRFKCVSKLWRSTISDPIFVKSHRSRSLTRPDGSGLLISSPNNNFRKQHYFYTNLQGNSGRHELTLPISNYYSVTQVINALVCFYDGNRVSVCNISTHEVLTLPVTSFNVNVNVNDFFGTPHYYFGFDPVNEEYKLLNTCTFYSCCPNDGDVEWEEWEILTLGADSWRKIDAAPFKFQTQSICIDRFIYWLHRIDEQSLVVVAFDVRYEKFLNFPVPQNAPRNLQPVQIGKRLALAGVTDCLRGSHNPLELWILMDLSNRTWIERRIHFPLAVFQRSCVLPVLPAHHIPMGDMLFTPLKLSLPLPVVYHDVGRENWITIEIAELPLSEVLVGERPLGKVCITPYVENILPLLNHS